MCSGLSAPQAASPRNSLATLEEILYAIGEHIEDELPPNLA
jgi:hypothetical protein